MKRKHQKITVFLLLLFLFSLSFSFAFAQEVEYPEIPGADTPSIKGGIPNYVKYIYNLAIALAGLLALFILMWSGIQYLTSTGKPDVLKSAKDRIKSALLGVLILLLSYLILITINPQLIIFQLSGLKEIPPEELPETPISPLIRSDLLGRIKEMAKVVKEIPDVIKNTAEEIGELTDKCSCERTQSLCVCTGGDDKANCEPSRCYAGPPSDPDSSDSHFHPCPDFVEIKNNQQKIIEWKDEILYYRNRAIAEAEDLKDNIEILNDEINWYNIKIAANEAVLEELEGESAKELQQRLIDASKEKRDWLIEERDYKEDLEQKLVELAEAIAETKEPVNNISQLPDECLVNVGNVEICTPTCKESKACHDFKDGCQPDKCSEDNPCPTDDIQKQIDDINPLPGKIIRICDEIISIINNIKETQERNIQF